MSSEEQRTKKQILVEWSGLDEAPAVYANSLSVSQTPYEFVLTFGLIKPPVDHEGEKKPERVTSNAAVRIFVSPTRMPDFIAALNQNFSKFTARIEKELARQKPHPETGERKS